MVQDLAQLITRSSSGKMQLVILDHVSGVLKPGRLTLLLGPPASGKSTLLKALSGRLEHSSLKVGFCVANMQCLLTLQVHHLGEACSLGQPKRAGLAASGNLALLKALLGCLERPSLKVSSEQSELFARTPA